MVLVGLLLLALIFVVVGVVLANVGWLIASLAVSVVAAAVLLRSYLQSRQRATTSGSGASVRAAKPATAEASRESPAPATETAGAETGAAGTGPAGPSLAQTRPAGPTSGGGHAVPQDTQVWVVDGYPEYHVEGCEELADLPAEAVPYEQAVEDGFQPCVVCNPDHALIPVAAPPASRQVLVIDGFPYYHAAGCRLLVGHDAEEIPLDQAVEDGFAPCDLCEPDAAAQPFEEVWVVDGFPNYHRAACAELRGLPAQAIPHDQAVEDGFAECPVCTPEAEQAPVAQEGTGEVWVVDGFPNYHRAGCAELKGQPAEAIPHEQAVEDGFMPCPLCRPQDHAEPGDKAEPQDEPKPSVERES